MASIALTSALVATLAFPWVLRLPPGNPKPLYIFLEQHPSLCTVVRVGFAMTGREDEFDMHIAVARFNRVLGPDVTMSFEPMDLPYWLKKAAVNTSSCREGGPGKRP